MNYFSNTEMHTGKSNLIDISLFQSGYQSKKHTQQPATKPAKPATGKAGVKPAEPATGKAGIKQAEPVTGKAGAKPAEPTTGKAGVMQAEKEIIPFAPNGSFASTKLECELETIQNEFLPIIPIVRYLKEKCLKNPTFATLVCKEGKTLSKCFQYAEQKVCKALEDKHGWLEDQQVYDYAETYYMTPDAILDWNVPSAITEKPTKSQKSKEKTTTTTQNKETKAQQKPKQAEQQQLSF